MKKKENYLEFMKTLKLSIYDKNNIKYFHKIINENTSNFDQNFKRLLKNNKNNIDYIIEYILNIIIKDKKTCSFLEKNKDKYLIFFSKNGFTKKNITNIFTEIHKNLT
jgi:hypothetical protein